MLFYGQQTGTEFIALWRQFVCSGLFPRFDVKWLRYLNAIFGQELHASPHLEHIPILSYPYISIYRTSWPYMDMWASMKFWPIFEGK